MPDLLPYEPEPGISPIVRDAFFDALNPKSSTAINVKEDGSVAIKANQPPPETKPKEAGGGVAQPKPTTTPGTQQPTTSQAQPTSPFAGFGPALAALAGGGGGGVSAATLTGLTPEQIANLLNVESQKQRLQQGTIGQLLELPYRQALTAKAMRPETPEVPLDVRTKAMEALIEQRKRISIPPRTLAEAKELKAAPGAEPAYPQGDWWRSPAGDIKFFDKGKDVPKDWERVPSREQVVSGLPEERFAYQKLKRSSDVRADIRDKDIGVLEAKALITQANEGSPESSLFVWDTRWGNEVVEAKLPEGFVADHFTPEITRALGEGKVVRVRHPVTGKPVKLRRKGGRLFAGENRIEIVK